VCDFFAPCRASKSEIKWFVTKKIVRFDPNCYSFSHLECSVLQTFRRQQRRAQRQEEQHGSKNVSNPVGREAWKKRFWQSDCRLPGGWDLLSAPFERQREEV
jgi:hypothetical protein